MSETPTYQGLDVSEVQKVFDGMRDLIVVLALKLRDADPSIARATAETIAADEDFFEYLPGAIKEEVLVALSAGAH